MSRLALPSSGALALAPFAFAVAVAVTSLAGTAPAHAWATREHRYLGRESFLAACRTLGTKLRTHAVPPEVAARFALACGAPVATIDATPPPRPLEDRAITYAQAVALAGDRLATPEEFFEALGGRRVLSDLNYARLALVNSSHFHPEAPRTWRRHHAAAIDDALVAAAIAPGAAQVQAFERAYFLHAFADHFVGDSFAAGHLGFNRPASSASAAIVFHDQHGDDGRILRNDRGDMWIGFGDGHLLDADDDRNRALVLEAQTASVRAFLHAFVTATRDPDADRQVELIVPSSFYSTPSPGAVVPLLRRLLAPDVVALEAFRARVEATPSDQQRHALGRTPWPAPAPRRDVHTHDDALLRPTTALARRVYKDHGLEARWIAGRTLGDDAREVQLLTGALHLRAGSDGWRFGALVGWQVRPEHRLIYGPALTWQLASTHSGLLTHDLHAAVLGNPACVTCADHLTALGAYRLNLEAGGQIVGLQVAPALVGHRDRWSWAWIVGLGLERLLSASGGGPL